MQVAVFGLRNRPIGGMSFCVRLPKRMSGWQPAVKVNRGIQKVDAALLEYSMLDYSEQLC